MPTVAARVMDLQEPTRKMSKSVSSPQGTISILDDPKDIERKIKRAVTDNDNEVTYDREKKPGIANLLDLLAAATGAVPSEVAERYERYGELKSDVAAAVIEMLTPLQERYATISADPGAVLDVLGLGAAKAASIADVTYQRAAEAIGLLAPR